MPSERVPDAIRRIVAARAQDYCEYCRCPGRFATESFTVEHTKPRIAGGETTLENLAWSCFGCNSHKLLKPVALTLKQDNKRLCTTPVNKFGLSILLGVATWLK